MSKVPAVTLGFWIIKIAATTLGETGGDTVTMTLNWGYLAGTALFLGLLVALVGAQIRATQFRPFLYWATIVASTTFGTNGGLRRPLAGHRLCRRLVAFADVPDRSAGALVLVRGHDLGKHRHGPEGGSLLLGCRHFLPDARYGARRLDRRHGLRVRRWRARVRRRARRHRCAICRDQYVARRPFLGSVHPDEAARGHSRRLPRQACERRRPCAEPADRVGGHRRFHYCLPPADPAAGRHSPGGTGQSVDARCRCER